MFVYAARFGPPPTTSRDTSASMLLTEAQIAEIRDGVKSGLRGPVMLKWIEWLLAERDELLRLAREGRPEKGRPKRAATVNQDGS